MYPPCVLSYEEAEEKLAAWARPLAPVRAPIEDALDRVLAEDVTAAGPLPPFDHSAMDGWAVRAEGVAPGVAIPIRGESRTGHEPAALEPGTAMRIFTGAPVPRGADAVIMQERATREGDRVTFEVAPRIGDNVRRAGEDAAAGAVVLRRGALLGPAQLGLLASVDRADVLVHPAPRVVVLPTGDELRPPGSPARLGTIPESNGLAIRGMATRAGAIARVVRPAEDDLATVTAAIEDALATSDVLLTIGGVSVGDHDVVKDALERAGCSLDAWKVAIRPGKPIVFGRRGDTLILGLPGNPASAMVTFGLFGVPVLRGMRGLSEWRARRRTARLVGDVPSPKGRRPFLRATLDGDSVHCAPNQASGATTATATSNALVTLPADSPGARAGDLVEVVPFAEIGL